MPSARRAASQSPPARAAARARAVTHRLAGRRVRPRRGPADDRAVDAWSQAQGPRRLRPRRSGSRRRRRARAARHTPGRLPRRVGGRQRGAAARRGAARARRAARAGQPARAAVEGRPADAAARDAARAREQARRRRGVAATDARRARRAQGLRRHRVAASGHGARAARGRVGATRPASRPRSSSPRCCATARWPSSRGRARCSTPRRRASSPTSPPASSSSATDVSGERTRDWWRRARGDASGAIRCADAVLARRPSCVDRQRASRAAPAGWIAGRRRSDAASRRRATPRHVPHGPAPRETLVSGAHRARRRRPGRRRRCRTHHRAVQSSL